VIWAYDGLRVSADSRTLIGGGSVGAVDLTVTEYDAHFNPVALVPDAPLTLEIDNTGTPAPTTKDGDCPAYDLGPGGYVKLSVTELDANGHIYEYELDAEF
jgi:hypothetical protein